MGLALAGAFAPPSWANPAPLAAHPSPARARRPAPRPPAAFAWKPPLLTPEAWMAKKTAGEAWLLVDVRITGAYRQDRAAGALSYPLELLFRDHPPPPPWPKGAKILLYCECPDEGSSTTAARLLRELLGSAEGIHVLQGGLEAYMAAGFPTEEGPPSSPPPPAGPAARLREGAVSAPPEPGPSPALGTRSEGLRAEPSLRGPLGPGHPPGQPWGELPPLWLDR